MLTRRIKNYIRDRAWISLKVKWKLRSGITVCIDNDNDWFVFNEIFTNKEYDLVFQFVLSSVPSKLLVLDLGANVGYFSIRIADELMVLGVKDFEIISVEGSPANCDILKKRMDQPLLKDKVKAVCGLAGQRTGYGNIVYSGQHYGHSSAIESNGSKASNVPYVDIEGLVVNKVDRVNLLKCDIEGSEEVFIAAYKELLMKVDNAVFEFHAGECNVENCRNMLKESGFIYRGIVKEDKRYKTSVEIFSRK